ncbi:hypothetical protein SAMN04487948_12932 [Halogranum amylolyticum]|uniref:Uncharacterized protein n=1 Tax=Halogranum amylolyticum TaxID=660520 RepID=A0A1H8WGF5_9EURY|nr:hypothetical protein [Halogranum amylolyticum]SEP26732.1 hypothetical protein SAMN04487948_12932 [Halogranum amylolyticum]
MDKDDIEKWSKRYDDDYEHRLQTIENDLHSALHDQGYLTQDGVVDAIRWKLDAQIGRRNGNIKKVRQLPEAFVEKVTEAALLVEDPKVQVSTLDSIPGVGAATASVILTFYDPKKYAVGDRYLMDELLDKDRTMGISDYPKILQALLDRNPGGYDLRTVEKAYWKRYTVENDVGNW